VSDGDVNSPAPAAAKPAKATKPRAPAATKPKAKPHAAPAAGEHTPCHRLSSAFGNSTQQCAFGCSNARYSPQIP